MSNGGVFYTRSPSLNSDADRSLTSGNAGSSLRSKSSQSEMSWTHSLYSSFGSQRIVPDRANLFELVEQQAWKKIRTLLKKKKWREVSKESDDTGLTLLGIAIVFAAPPDIIDLILSIDPHQFYITDVYGATPLHMACLNGASTATVTQLMNFGCDVTLCDVDNRVPLHHTVECICLDGIDFDEGVQVIKILTDADPSMVLAKDKQSDTPLDIAQIARITNAHDEEKSKRFATLYYILRDVSVALYRYRKADWESKGPKITKFCLPSSAASEVSNNSKGTRSTYVGSTQSYESTVRI